MKRWHVHALPEKERFEITFPRVEGYTFAMRNRVALDWSSAAPIELDPGLIPSGSDVKGLSISERGNVTLQGPGQLERVTLEEFRAGRRVQELEFDLAKALTQDAATSGGCPIPTQVLFPRKTLPE